MRDKGVKNLYLGMLHTSLNWLPQNHLGLLKISFLWSQLVPAEQNPEEGCLGICHCNRLPRPLHAWPDRNGYQEHCIWNVPQKPWIPCTDSWSGSTLSKLDSADLFLSLKMKYRWFFLSFAQQTCGDILFYAILCGRRLGSEDFHGPCLMVLVVWWAETNVLKLQEKIENEARERTEVLLPYFMGTPSPTRTSPRPSYLPTFLTFLPQVCELTSKLSADILRK